MEPVPTHTTPQSVVVMPAKVGTTFGSLVTAMAVGAFLAVSVLYFWGAEIAQDQQIAHPSTDAK